MNLLKYTTMNIFGFKHLLYSLCVMLICHGMNGQESKVVENLRNEFKDPSMKSWPKTYYWWLNANIDTVRIKEEITSMKNAGLSGFDIFEIGAPKSDTVIPAGNIPFMGDGFLKAVKVALDQAAKLNMEVGLNVASSWNAGGSWTTPENSAKSIYFSKSIFNGKEIKLPFPELVRAKKEGIQLEKDNNKTHIVYAKNGRPAFYTEIVVLALPAGKPKIQTTDIIDVTEYFDFETETLNWKHDGEYDIYRYICSNSGEQLKLPSKNSKGPIIDHFDAQATEAHFTYIIDRLKTILGNDISKSALKSFYLASYEALGNVWTLSLPEEFKKLNGYDIYPFIPSLFNKNLLPEDVTKKFKKDFQYTLSELMINNFYRKAKEISNNHGLKINSESGGPGFPLHNVPVDPLKALGVMDIPRGEFWINHTRLNKEGIDILRVVKEASSASHIYGRGIVEEEAFTTFQHWQEGPFEMKPNGDRAFCEGMNKVVVHGSSHNPRGTGYPGYAYYAGTHYNDKRVWWSMIRPFNQYLARISDVLQKTDFEADVLYYYGDAVPNFAGHKNSRFSIGPGFDYEVINTEILKQLTTKDGNLVLPTGGQFKLLALANEGDIDPEVLLKLKELVSKGVKILGERPNKVIVRENLPQLKVTIDDIDNLWRDYDKSDFTGKGLKGKVISGITPLAMLKLMGVSPDFQYPDDEFNTLDYIHYEKQGSDFYFIRNTTDQWISRQCAFRQLGKVPEIWNPVTGEVNKVSIYEQEAKTTNLPLTLPPFGSTFVVFSKGKYNGKYTKISSNKSDPPLLKYTPIGTLVLEKGDFKLTNGTKEQYVSNYITEQNLDGAWEVFFPEGQEAPRRTIFPELISWSKSEIEGIKYFSGIAKYVKTFQYDINSSFSRLQNIYLDLGDLSNVGEVWLNGKHLGIAWAKPYRFDVTDVIKFGDNLLEVEVANTWSNRLKGDAILKTKFTNTNIRDTDISGLNKIDVPWKDVPLLDSGLLGPVKLQILKPLD